MVEKIQILQEQDAIVARQRGRDLAKQLGFSLVDQTRIAISISELARNMLLYAGAGDIELYKVEAAGDVTGIEIRAEDKGPGIIDLEMAMTDGYTSAGGLGMGLPGTKRLMDEFEINSELGKGTSVVIRKWLSA